VRDPQNDDQNNENFNISIAKLKKTFKLAYLLEILSEPDNFID
jgi:hypothetical protein